MKLYLDQMLRVELADLLRANGHDVVRAAEVGQDRADDAEILARCCQEIRILITRDKDFGDWATLPLQQHTGVIRLKVRVHNAASLGALLMPFLAQHVEDDFRNKLVILSASAARWIKTA